MVLEQFGATIEKLYAAASDGSRWTEALTSVEELTGSAGAIVHIVPKMEGSPVISMLGSSGQEHFPADHVAEWTRDYAALCPRLAAATKFPDAPFVCDRMILSEHEMDRDPVYQWYAEHGLRYFIGSPLSENRDAQMVWSLQRSKAQGHVQQAEVEVFELIKPHVARAVTLASQLGTLRAVDRLNSAVFQALPHAVFALDAAGRVLLANPAAAAVLAASDGLYVEEGKLCARHALEQTPLDRAVVAAATEPARAGDLWVRVSRRNGGPPYAVFIAPLNVADEQLTAAQAKVLVVVHDTAARTRLKPGVLTGLYGLTEAEARLASALAAGHSLESAAALLGITLATVRSELKLVFRKLGVTRQQDLVRLLTPLSMIGAAAEEFGAH